MTAMVRKCKVCGYCPAVEEIECPVDFNPFEFFCNHCKGWSRTEKCSGCHQRVELERNLESARRRNDLAGALAAAQVLVDKYPGKPEYRAALTSLQFAVKALEACGRIGSLPLDTWRGVKVAKELFQRARTSLRSAGLSESLAETGYEKILDEAEEHLAGGERIKKQMVTAIPRALVAAVAIGAAWLLAHAVGAWSNTEAGGYLWLRNSAMAVAAVAWLGIISRKSWGMPGWLIAAMGGAFVLGMLFVTSMIYDFWPGLWIWVFAVTAGTWLVESGMDKPEKPDPYRGALTSTAQMFKSSAGAKTWAVLIIGLVVLFLAAPLLKPPRFGQAAEASTADWQPPAPVREKPYEPQFHGGGTILTTEEFFAAPPSAPPVKVIELPEPEPPVVSIDSVWPPQPVAGKPMRIALAATTSTPGEVRFEYRRAGGQWTTTPAEYVDDDPPEGEYEVEFRCVDEDRRFSKTVSRGLTVIKPPAVSIASAAPAELMEPATLTVQLQGNRPDARLRFEYRKKPEEIWHTLIGDTLMVSNLPAGFVELEFRARDAHGNASPAISAEYRVKPLSSVPLDVTIADVDPAVPKIGSDLRVQLDCKRNSPGLVYKFRHGGARAWTDSSAGVYNMKTIAGGKLLLDYGVVDTAVGDHSKMYSKSWDVVEPRYEITGVRMVAARLVADVRDRDEGDTYVVGYADEFGHFKVQQISLTLCQFKATADNGTSLVLEVPKESVERLRVKARTNVRGRNS